MKRWIVLFLALAAMPAFADEVARLHALFNKNWERRVHENPLFATSVGRHEFDDRLPSITPADLARRNRETLADLAELKTIDKAKLPHVEVVNYEIFREQLENAVDSYKFGDYEMPINADSGFHMGFARLPEEMPLRTVKDYENYISRLRAWPRYVNEEIALMRLGLKRGFTVPKATL